MKKASSHDTYDILNYFTVSGKKGEKRKKINATLHKK